MMLNADPLYKTKKYTECFTERMKEICCQDIVEENKILKNQVYTSLSLLKNSFLVKQHKSIFLSNHLPWFECMSIELKPVFKMTN